MTFSLACFGMTEILKDFFNNYMNANAVGINNCFFHFMLFVRPNFNGCMLLTYVCVVYVQRFNPRIMVKNCKKSPGKVC